MAKRVFLVVLDSFGVGEEPDAASFGDFDVNTLRSIAHSDKFDCPNLRSLGLFNLDGADALPPCPAPLGAFARLRERSMGKDTTIGHWEIAGLESPAPLPTYPNGFPEELIREFEQRTGRCVLCNLPYSGTEVLKDYGEEHLRTGALIVYTSADSVFQIAAHESIVPVEQLYEYCRIARSLLVGEHGVGRVIARPFEGTNREDFRRTPRRHDFSLLPPGKTMLNVLAEAGKAVIGVGKINDIFAGSGITQTFPTGGNAEGQQRLLELAKTEFEGLAFVNLVDFDMLYGHRRDIDGYAAAATSFDRTLGELLGLLQPEDLLIITADHGCDPAYQRTTDHTREYVPFLAYGAPVAPGTNLGTIDGFGAIAATVCDYLGVDAAALCGKDVWPQICRYGNRMIHRVEVDEFWADSTIIEAGDFVFVGYCMGNEGKSIEEQMDGAFTTLKNRLAMVGLGLDSVVKMDCLFKDIEDLNVLSEAIKKRFPGKYPTRKAFTSDFIREGIRFQVDAIAYKG